MGEEDAPQKAPGLCSGGRCLLGLCVGGGGSTLELRVLSMFGECFATELTPSRPIRSILFCGCGGGTASCHLGEFRIITPTEVRGDWRGYLSEQLLRVCWVRGCELVQVTYRPRMGCQLC